MSILYCGDLNRKCKMFPFLSSMLESSQWPVGDGLRDQLIESYCSGGWIARGVSNWIQIPPPPDCLVIRQADATHLHTDHNLLLSDNFFITSLLKNLVPLYSSESHHQKWHLGLLSHWKKNQNWKGMENEL